MRRVLRVLLQIASSAVIAIIMAVVGVFCLDQFLMPGMTVGAYLLFSAASIVLWVPASFVLVSADFFRTCAVGLISPLVGGALVTIGLGGIFGVLTAVLCGAVTFPVGLATAFLVRAASRSIDRQFRPQAVMPPPVIRGS